MDNPNDSGEDRFIEKLGRMEDQADGGRFKRLIIIYLIIAALLSFSIALAAEPPPLPQKGEHPGGVVKMTRPDGTAIWVNPRTVAFIRGPLEGEQGHTTIVFSSGAKQSVLESIDEIGRIMKMERQHLPDSDDPP